jgi:hypothetical protein
MTAYDIVCLGGGNASGYLAKDLVAASSGETLCIITDEAVVAYERPALSKGYLEASSQVGSHQERLLEGGSSASIKVIRPLPPLFAPVDLCDSPTLIKHNSHIPRDLPAAGPSSTVHIRVCTVAQETPSSCQPQPESLRNTRDHQRAGEGLLQCTEEKAREEAGFLRRASVCSPEQLRCEARRDLLRHPPRQLCEVGVVGIPPPLLELALCKGGHGQQIRARRQAGG